MRALTLIRPMSAAVVHGTKRIENRPRDLPKSMRDVETVVAVHAGKKWDAGYWGAVQHIDGYLQTMPLYESRVQDEGIVGLMLLTGRVLVSHIECAELVSLQTARWFGGPYGYEISRAVAFPDPIQCRGMQGWWPVPKDAIAQMRAQVDRGVDAVLAEMFYEVAGEVWPCPNCRSGELCESGCPVASWNL